MVTNEAQVFLPVTRVSRMARQTETSRREEQKPGQWRDGRANRRVENNAELF